MLGEGFASEDFGSEDFVAEVSVDGDELVSDLDSVDFDSDLPSDLDSEDVVPEVFESEAADFL